MKRIPMNLINKTQRTFFCWEHQRRGLINREKNTPRRIIFLQEKGKDGKIRLLFSSTRWTSTAAELGELLLGGNILSLEEEPKIV